jgi:hypothetical protein
VSFRKQKNKESIPVTAYQLNGKQEKTKKKNKDDARFWLFCCLRRKS